MNPVQFILTLACLSCSLSCTSQSAGAERIKIGIPSIQQEASSIWRTINDIVFFEQQGYQVNLPKADLIQTLIVESKKGKFGNDHFAQIYNLLDSNVYQQGDYDAALKKVKDQEALVNDLIQQLKTSSKDWDWDFKLYESYPVVFTLYGTGGSYNPDLGEVTLFTTTDGKFMNYREPANTIIHEIVHMGIEESIVQKYQLPHGLKERIVDTIVYLLFKQALPDYRIQNMGDTKIDEYLKQIEDIQSLPSKIEQYLAQQ